MKVMEKATKTKVIRSGNTAERDIVINGTHIHVKSVFNDKIPLERALGNIAKQKLTNFNKSNKF